MSKFFKNLKKNILPLFFIFVLISQPLYTYAEEPSTGLLPLPGDILLPADGVKDTRPVADETPADFGSLEPTNDPNDPFTDTGYDPFTPGDQSVDLDDPYGNSRLNTEYPIEEYPADEVDGTVVNDAITTSPGDIDAQLSSTIDRVRRTSTQAQAYANGTGSSTTQGAGSIPGSAGACIAGKLLSTILASTITTAINGIVNTAETIVGTAIGLLSVPVADWNVKLDTLRTKEQLQFNNAAQIGTSAGVPGSINALVNVSWNSVGYCIINSMIDYIARSTIAWAKSGFKGNPAFIENPGQFFKDIGNIEASSFLNTLAYGVLGQNICQPFRAQIVLTIARDYLDSNGSGYYGSAGYGGGGYNGIGNPRTFGGCSLDDAKNNFKSFLKGNFNEGGWNSWLKVSQIDTNNPYSVYLNLSSQLNSRVTQRKTIADKELTWNKGFLSFRKCENKNMKPQDCPIVTPGNLIEDQLSKTLNLSKDRLVLAEKFDQVLDVVINQLINTALSKLLN